MADNTVADDHDGEMIEWLMSLGADKLDEVLGPASFSIRKMDGTEYEPSTLTNMKCSLERYLRSKNYSASLNDRVFHKLNQAIRAKQVHLKGQGKGRKELKSEEISAEEEETMWQAGVLGINNPQSANFTMFFYSENTWMRGRNEHQLIKFTGIVTGHVRN
ncbi:uncharacterized protein KIAA1958-like [Ptychodera flava]|uniref:uncharacterized protein KIAA1958-like n=1 Tax=Ptychodera flava TaxID=63121 RepID=UPI00396A0C8F